MTTLYELTEQFQNVLDILETLENEEIPAELQEAIEEILTQKSDVETEIYNKIDNYISLIKHLEMFAEMREREAKRMAELAKRDRKKIDFLKNRLIEHLKITGNEQVKTSKFSLGVRQASQAPLVVKGNIDDLPDEFKKVIIEADKKALRDAIKSEVEGIEQYAELGERSSYLSIR